jgi:DNA-binding response OmpR family regulator
MEVVLLANDLMVASRLQSAVSQSSAHFQTATSGAQAIELCQGNGNCLLVIDLALPGLELDLVRQLKAGQANSTRIVAFGPHVHAERLAAAREAGCDLVLSRGQFFSQIELILKNETV